MSGTIVPPLVEESFSINGTTLRTTEFVQSILVDVVGSLKILRTSSRTNKYLQAVLRKITEGNLKGIFRYWYIE